MSNHSDSGHLLYFLSSVLLKLFTDTRSVVSLLPYALLVHNYLLYRPSRFA